MKKFIRIYLIFIMIFATRIYASEVIDCTVSDAYIEWSNLSPEEKSKYITPEYCESYGLDDNFEIVNDEEEGVVTNKKMLTVSYPSKYVSVSTPVKNQKYTQTCWAFSSTTVLESHILKNYDVLTEFSPGHMNYMESLSFYNFVNTHSRIRYVNDGGNFTDAAMYYINKYGPVLESEYKTNTDDDILPFVYPETIIGAKNIIEVNDIEFDYRSKSGACTSNEKNKIKSLIYNYGPTAASMFMDNLYLSNYSYIYKSTNKNVTTNHGVTIIGWDDNYSTSNFNGRFKPSKNGAWIVQNSYGTSFGDNGIFYISYEDDEICTNIFSIRNIDPYITDNRYITSEQRALSTTALTTQMSVFNKKSSVNEYLTKVSFEVMKPTNYKVYYYAGDAKKDNVKTSKMKLIASGSVDYTGWISVVPSKSITIPKGVKKYSIAVNK